MAQKLALAIAFCLCAQVAAHSWVACADYGSETDTTYDDSKCKGYGRYWSQMAAQSGGVFGVDTGYNYQISNGQVCRDTMANPPSAAYTSRYPMATYAPGERICLAWPSKNHVAASCTNPYVPDTALLVALSPVNPTSDPSESVFLSNVIANLTQHQNGVIDFKGFQHCPAFCDNMDKSFCSQCFNLPSNLQEGRYVMLWYWIFNPGSAPYTTCMDINISGSGSSSSAASTTAATTSTTATTAATTSTTATTAATTSTTAATTSTTAATTTTSATTATTAATSTTAAATTSTTGSQQGTTTTTTSTTGVTPSTGSSSGSGFEVFGDSLASGYTWAWSWQSTVSVVNGGAYSGSSAISASIQSWGGLQIGQATTPVQYQGVYSKITFALKADAATTQFNVWFASGGSKRYSVTLDTNWKVFTLDLVNDLGAPSTIFNPSGLVFFNDGPASNTLYVDSLELLP